MILLCELENDDIDAKVKYVYQPEFMSENRYENLLRNPLIFYNDKYKYFK
jgi:hypothetical protein